MFLNFALGVRSVLGADKHSSGETVSQEQLNQAVSIIRQRIDAAGVSEAEISTEGSQNIVVSIPPEREVGSIQLPRSVPGNPATDFVVTSSTALPKAKLADWFTRQSVP